MVELFSFEVKVDWVDFWSQSGQWQVYSLNLLMCWVLAPIS